MRNYSASHERDLLLWYVTDRLTLEDRDRVERHLLTCTACRSELNLWREIAGAAQYSSQVHQPPLLSRQRVWQALEQKLDQAPQLDISVTRLPRRGRPRVIRPLWRKPTATSYPVGRPAISVAALVMVIIVVALYGLLHAFIPTTPVTPRPTPFVTPKPTLFVTSTPTNTGGTTVAARKWMVAIGVQAPSNESLLAISNGVLYYTAENGVFALNVSDQQILWSKPNITPLRAPMLDGATLYIAVRQGGFAVIQRYDRVTGQLMGTVAGASIEGATSLAVANGVVYAVATTGIVSAVRASDSAVLWQTPIDQPPQNTSGNPVQVVNNIIFTGGKRGNYYALNATTGAVLAKIPTLTSDKVISFSEASVEQDIVCVFATTFGGDPQNNILFALRLSDQRVLWQKPLRNLVNSPPTIANGSVYALETAAAPSTSTLLAFDAQTGQDRWRFTNHEVYLTLTVAGSALYVGGLDGVSGFDIRGTLLWHIPLDNALSLTSALLYADSLLYLRVTVLGGRTQAGEIIAIQVPA